MREDRAPANKRPIPSNRARARLSCSRSLTHKAGGKTVKRESEKERKTDGERKWGRLVTHCARRSQSDTPMCTAACGTRPSRGPRARACSQEPGYFFIICNLTPLTAFYRVLPPPHTPIRTSARSPLSDGRANARAISNNTQGDTPCVCPRLYYYTVLFFYFLYKFVSSPWRPRISRGAATPCAPAAAARFSSLARARVHVGVNSVFDFPGG